MKIHQLSEGLSPVLFHFTSLFGAGKIAAEDRFRLSATFSNPSEEQTGAGGKHFFLSVTRSRIGGYTLRSSYNKNVVLVLDGKKLSHRFSGGPVQYWSRSMINMDWKYDEQEDRIYHTEPYINDASSYIKEAHVLLVPERVDITSVERRALLRMKTKFTKVYVYDDERAFILMDKRRAVSIKGLEYKKFDGRGEVYDRYASKKAERRREKSNKRDYSEDRWLALLTIPVEHFNRLHYHDKDLLRGLSFPHLFSDTYNVFSADLQNNKNNPTFTGKLAKIMRRYKLKTGREVLEFIRDRWKPALDAYYR